MESYDSYVVGGCVYALVASYNNIIYIMITLRVISMTSRVMYKFDEIFQRFSYYDSNRDLPQPKIRLLLILTKIT